MTTTAGLLVILGAAVGAPTRSLTDRWLQSTHGTGLPWGTFTVNIVAWFVLGLAAVARASHAVAVLIGTGFCGALHLVNPRLRNRPARGRPPRHPGRRAPRRRC
ncbi:fluoride efflux transporter FluC [Actinomycetospora chibensis]|uniref:Fluoride-specific ion channel n=1 Tax=Actinomycetospora chibensis TaxID=663606 RepID=A0ABV9RVU6_9PSEU|nr:CrcB family protein [Actinomycetospora chibensis]MDD7927506.1 CrcB family protein [Actinomycetospora chibensis]